MNVEYFSYLSSTIRSVARCTREIKSRIAMAKPAIGKETDLFHQQIGHNLRKKLLKCYILSIGFYGAGTWTLTKVVEKDLESVPMWCWRRTGKISWTVRVRNEEVLLRPRRRRISYRQ